MLFSELRWMDRTDELTVSKVSQRLRYIDRRRPDPRIYVLSWGDNKYTIVCIAPFSTASKNEYIRNLDITDVAVHLLEMKEDTRTHDL